MNTPIDLAWVAFSAFWLLSATTAKPGTRARVRDRWPGLVVVVIAVVLIRVVKPGGLRVDSPALEALGTVLLAAGLALAIWARVYLGRNWGMPMTQKDEPELVTTGPYRHIRHPIYSGILLALLGTALATTLYWLVLFAGAGAYFVMSATVEERVMTDAFPQAYPSYRASTRMLIPFVL